MTPAMTAARATDTPSTPRSFRVDQRFIAPILITFILLAAELTFHNLEDYRKTLLAIVSSIAAEIILGLLITKKMPHLASAYVSGISCGILIRSPEWWPYALAGIIATTSKYVIRLNGRHLWNPSNLAIVILLLVAPSAVATLSIQWDNRLWAMAIIWLLGSVIIWNLKRFHICATYVFFFFVYAFLRTLYMHWDALPNGYQWEWFKSEIAPITGPMYQLFVFFMITDPKTTTQSRWGQMTVAFLIATVESALRLWGPAYFPHVAIHAPYFALTLMGPSSNLIEIFFQWQQKQKAERDKKHVAIPAIAA